MSEAALVKQTTVVHIEGEVFPDEYPIFSNADGDNMDSWIDVVMSNGLWEDFGKPRTVTITIEPGDKLNG